MKTGASISSWQNRVKHFGYGFSLSFLFICPICPQTCNGQGLVFFDNHGTSSGITNGLTWQLAEAGTKFQVALYFAQVGVLDESQFMQLDMPIGLARPGFFFGNVLTAPTAQPAGGGFFQVRVWESAYGTTFEEAVANHVPQNGRLALAGESGILDLLTGGTDHIGRPPGTLVGAHAIIGKPLDDGILLTVVPEPSRLPVFLACLTAVALFTRRLVGKAKYVESNRWTQ